MPNWSYLIVIGALVIGLRQSISATKPATMRFALSWSSQSHTLRGASTLTDMLLLRLGNRKLAENKAKQGESLFILAGGSRRGGASRISRRVSTCPSQLFLSY